MDIKNKEVFLFDLDGTLLFMDQKKFTKYYVGGLMFIAPPFKQLHMLKGMLKGIDAMYHNDGTKTNKDAFRETFNKASKLDFDKMEDKFEKYYRTKFIKCRKACPKNPLANNVIETLKAQNKRLILATNPFFPEVAVRRRLGWAGIDPNNFEYISFYSNNCASKPNPLFFEQLVEKLHLEKDKCIMVGNDVYEDAAAIGANIDTIFLTDDLLNKKNLDISHLTLMTMQEFYDLIK